MKYVIYRNGVGGWRWALFADDETITKPIAVAPVAYPSEDVCRGMLDLVRKSLVAPVRVEANPPARCWHIDPDRW